ncbi:MAG: SulP family inorganic anion transporter [Deltaproteobacteria bacterium]|nr:SulP family inorganic anion transporter [Deltaproteobacteria bacterium]
MLVKIFPFISWFKNYSLDSFRVDAISGLTVALVLIPQSMAYAQLAGLPAYYGLYASFLPPMIAALFGSSRQLATGPVAVVSLMTAASLEPLATAGSEGYIVYAILLALMVGVFQFTLGVLRLGLVVNFLSHPVVNGFTNAAAIIIASSQLSKMFGVYVDKAHHHYETIIRVIQSAVHYTHWPTLLMGTLAFAIMYGLRRISPKIPNVLVAVAVTTIISYTTGFNHNATVTLSAIESAGVKDTIVNFNKAVMGIPDLAEKRSEAGKVMDKAKKSGDTISILRVQHDLDVITIQIERLKHYAHIHRTELRNLLFKGIEQSDGSLKFYTGNEAPAGLKDDGRIWRIKVGNRQLITDKLLLSGGGAVVGVIPEGLPSLSIPKINFKILLHLFPFAAIISLLGFMEAISIAKAMAAKTGQRLDPNQELIQSGALSGLSSVITSLMVVVVLLFFTPLLYHLPQSVLAAVIMMAVIGLVNVTGFIHAWRAQWYDGVIAIITFVLTLAFAPHLEKGIEIGVVLSLIVFLYKSMRPKIATLSRCDDKSLRDCIALGLKQCEYMAMVRFDGPLFFANASYLEDQVTEIMLGKKNLKHIIIVSNGINDMDASGEEALALLVDRVRSAGVDISMSGVNEPVMKLLKRTHFLEHIGEDHIYPTMESAIDANYAQTHSEGLEEKCPLLTVCFLE